MPKHSIDLLVRGQVLAAYAAYEEQSIDFVEPEGNIVKRTRIILENLRRTERQATHVQLKFYYTLGEQWHEEVASEEDHHNAVKALWRLVPKMDARVAERVYQLFKCRPEALDRLTGITKSHFFDLSAAAYIALRIEVERQDEILRLLENRASDEEE